MGPTDGIDKERLLKVFWNSAATATSYRPS
jgi:hypothetical protein